MKRKCLAVGIILLFVVVAVAPSINISVVKASTDNELIEVTTEVCGINGIGNHTVRLTKQQYQELQQYLVEFRAKLNITTSKEEVIPIFNEAIMEINKYGLLPKGMSVDQAQQFITGEHQNQITEKLFEALRRKNQVLLNESENVFCLVTGSTDNTASYGPIWRNILRKLELHFILNVCFSRILFLLTIILAILGFIPNFNPILIGSTMCLGREVITLGPPGWPQDIFPSHGWVNTVGLNGKKEWNGTFYGQLPIMGIPWVGFGVLFGGSYFFPAIFGFTGIKIYDLHSIHQSTFIGTALWVKIGSEPPE
jgi:hypothetical protein